MNNNHDIEKTLSETSFRTLSNEEQSRVWSAVARTRTLSPKSIHTTMLKPILTALILAVALGGTVALADNSVPGDPLFGLDRAVENARISLASGQKKNDLRIAFAGERVKEVEKITTVSPSMARPASADISEGVVSRIEADVFTNETLVKIEYGTNKKFVFTNNAKTKVLVVEDIVKNFPSLTKTFVESKLDFQIEDRASRAEDKTTSNDLSSKDKTRVTVGVNAAIALLNSVSASADANSSIRLKAITDELNRYLGTLPTDSTVGVSIKNDDDESRIDIRTVDGKIRVEVKEGEIKIKTDDNSGKSEYKGGDDDDDNYESRDDNKSKDRDDDDDEDEDRDDDDDKPRTPPVVVTPPSGTTATSYALADVGLHNTSVSCWTVVSGSVYNITSWISQHPGGSSAIKAMCGVDATAAFTGQHGGQSRPVSELAGFKIGVLK